MRRSPATGRLGLRLHRRRGRLADGLADGAPQRQDEARGEDERRDRSPDEGSGPEPEPLRRASHTGADDTLTAWRTASIRCGP